jgi:hypothetical protein
MVPARIARIRASRSSTALMRAPSGRPAAGTLKSFVRHASNGSSSDAK